MPNTATDLFQDKQRAFMGAWLRAIHLTGHAGLFGQNPAAGLSGFAPKVKEINRALPTLPKSQGALIAAMVSFFNPEEGARMMTKTGTAGLGALSLCLSDSANQVLADLICNYQGW